MASLTIENVQNYPRPPALREVPHRLRIEFGGQTIVETDQALQVIETHHAPTYYVPPHDIDAVLTGAVGKSFCEWKGVASYWDVQSGTAKAAKAAWSYAAPTPDFEPIKDYLAFYAERMDACYVGTHRVISQPGGSMAVGSPRI
ncbi:DUF427 domain-containing protein [Tropicibacter sp. R16_0]|uniref:DUF427 domain-containing protein n=1 Tax=Tropicibacter sp. R16_0 TaxID=2821102 RepID=UPI00257110DA|nr:DUF427 domain-containing protein [Tropicibacter sp. R16_0]